MKGLVLVDLQNDFLPGGALPVPEGDAVIPVANRLMGQFNLVLAVQDWHPPRHGSFASSHEGKAPGDVIELDGLEQILWPDHCVQGTRGAELADALDASRIKRVFKKGIAPQVDSYSAFFDNAHRRATGLGDYLQQDGIGQVYLAGLATDYCVRFSALDAAELGFQTFVIADACRGVNLKPDDSRKAIEEIALAGVAVIRSDQV